MALADEFVKALQRHGSLSEREATLMMQIAKEESSFVPPITLDPWATLPPDPYSLVMPPSSFAPGGVIGTGAIVTDPSALPSHFDQTLTGDFDEEAERARCRELDDAREPRCATCGRIVQSWGPLPPHHDRHCKTCDLDFQYEATSYGDQEGDEVAWQERYRAARMRRLELHRQQQEVTNADGR